MIHPMFVSNGNFALSVFCGVYSPLCNTSTIISMVGNEFCIEFGFFSFAFVPDSSTLSAYFSAIAGLPEREVSRSG